MNFGENQNEIKPLNSDFIEIVKAFTKSTVEQDFNFGDKFQIISNIKLTQRRVKTVANPKTLVKNYNKTLLWATKKIDKINFYNPLFESKERYGNPVTKKLFQLHKEKL